MFGLTGGSVLLALIIMGATLVLSIEAWATSWEARAKHKYNAMKEIGKVPEDG